MPPLPRNTQSAAVPLVRQLSCCRLQAADGPKKTATKKAPKRTANTGDAGPTVKRAKNTFMYFCSDKRAALKGELHTLNSYLRRGYMCDTCPCSQRHASMHACNRMEKICSDVPFVTAESDFAPGAQLSIQI